MSAHTPYNIPVSSQLCDGPHLCTSKFILQFQTTLPPSLPKTRNPSGIHFYKQTENLLKVKYIYYSIYEFIKHRTCVKLCYHLY